MFKVQVDEDKFIAVKVLKVKISLQFHLNVYGLPAKLSIIIVAAAIHSPKATIDGSR